MLYEQTDKMKTLRSCQLYAEVISDRAEQVVECRERKKVTKKEDEEYYKLLMEQLAESESKLQECEAQLAKLSAAAPAPEQESAVAALTAELHALKLRPLIRRAEQWGVDDTKLDAAKTTDTIVALIVEKMRAEGASLEPGVPRVVKPCSPRCGHALGKLLPILLARMVVVSTPERGTRSGGAPYDEIPVMSGLEPRGSSSPTSSPATTLRARPRRRTARSRSRTATW